MLIYTTADNYIWLNLPRILSELTKDDKEKGYALRVNVFKIPFGAENANFCMVYIKVINIKLKHKQAFLDMLKEKFGLDPVWLTKDEDYIYKSNKTVANYNLEYKVPVSLIEKLAVLYKMTA